MSDPTTPSDVAEDELVAKLTTARQQLLDEMHKVIVGQDDVLEQLILAVLCRGHCLLQGVPGLAKTVMVQTLAQVLDLDTLGCSLPLTCSLRTSQERDIIEDPETGRRQFEFLAGPLFSNLVLADEINRTPPKTQAALLKRCRNAA